MNMHDSFSGRPRGRRRRYFARGLALVATALAVVALCPSVPAQDDTSQPAGKDAAGWAPKLYAFCMGMPGKARRTIPEQAEMLRELGFDGAGYPLWLGEELEKNLGTLDAAGIDVFMLYTSVNLKPDKPPYDPRVPEAMRKLKGRPVTICVLLQGMPPGDARGMEPAVAALGKLGDVAAEAGLRISIYHHVGDWTQSLPFAIKVVEKVDHAQVGVNFNLCHWLKVEGEKDYRPVLREHAAKVFVVTINGAQLGTNKWADGLIQPLDRGDFDNRALLATLRDAGYRGPVGLMCYGIPGDAREHLERSMKVWKTWKAEWTPK
jgi:sugar phosphate isomerase/epimerase